MRGKKAKALRRGATVRGIHNRELYRGLKKENTRPESFGRPGKMGSGKPRKDKPLPVAPRAGAKPMHLVRKIIELQVEREMKIGKHDKELYGMMPRYRLLEALVDARDPEWSR